MTEKSNVLNEIKALSDRNRLLIVYALQRNRELCACRITEFLGVAGATASRHLALLVNAGLLGSEKKGRWVYYYIGKNFETQNPELKEWLARKLATGFLTEAEEARLEIAATMDEEELCRRQRKKDGAKNV